MARMITKATTLVTVLAGSMFLSSCGGNEAVPASTVTQPQGPEAVVAAAQPTPEIEAMTQAVAALGPHQQATMPPVPLPVGYAPARPPEVVTAAYLFAAEHPEISSYVPCFCGCQQGGHKGNHDCFVKSRAANGDVIAWEEHGAECAVCIDVATRSRQLLASGASVSDIRAAIEREFLPSAVTMTPTPKPPAAHSH
jgi:hypothetical protein